MHTKSHEKKIIGTGAAPPVAVTLELTYALLAVSRGARRRVPRRMMRLLLARELVSRDRGPGGRRVIELTEAGGETLLDSRYFDAARAQLDAEQSGEPANQDREG